MARSYSHDFGTTTIEAATNYVMNIENAEQGAAFQVNAVVNSTAKTVANDTGVNITTEVLTSTAHGFFIGLKVRLTSSGTLPTGLALATDYYVQVLTANTLALHTTMAGALASTRGSTDLPNAAATLVNITALGTAASTITITPVSVSGGSYKLQYSNDYVPANESATAIASGNWIDAVAGETLSVVTNNITATANTSATVKNIAHNYVRVLFAISAGSYQIRVIGSNK